MTETRKTRGRPAPVTCLFVDVGGVLLTNGWDHHARRRAAKNFGLDRTEMDSRHRLNFEVHEEDKLSFDDYLERVVFYRKRLFTRTQFRSFMCAQSKPFLEMLELIHQVKAKHGLKVALVNNESRELNAYRIKTFKLDGFVDSFVSSCYVHLRKPDIEIYRLALDVSQATAQQVVYIENTPLFVEIAQGMGIRSILHTDYKSTTAKLAALGLS